MLTETFIFLIDIHSSNIMAVTSSVALQLRKHPLTPGMSSPPRWQSGIAEKIPGFSANIDRVSILVLGPESLGLYLSLACHGIVAPSMGFSESWNSRSTLDNAAEYLPFSYDPGSREGFYGFQRWLGLLVPGMEVWRVLGQPRASVSPGLCSSAFDMLVSTVILSRILSVNV